MNETMVTVVGNVANEPELRTTASGRRVVNFRLASTVRYFDKGVSGWRDGDTVFWAVSCWQNPADNVAESVVKGQPVVVHGKLKFRSYDDKNGQQRNSLELEAVALGHDLTKGIATFRKASGSNRDTVAQGEEAAEEPREGDAQAERGGVGSWGRLDGSVANDVNDWASGLSSEDGTAA